MPPEARADLAMIQVHLTRKTVPDEDPEQTLLKWLAERGFHDVLALRADASYEVCFGFVYICMCVVHV